MNQGSMATKKYLDILRRRTALFLTVFFVVFAVVVCGMFVMTPTYEAAAKVLLVQSTQSAASLMTTLGITSATITTGAQGNSYDTDIALATLQPLLTTLITKLDLRDRAGNLIKPEKLVKWTVLHPILPRPYLSVSQLESSDIITIVADATTPEQAARMSNELAKLYLEDRVKRLRSEYASVRQFLQDHIQEVKRDYTRALEIKKSFLIAEQTIDLQEESKSLISEISTLETKINDLLTELSGKTTDFTAMHPDLQALSNKIEMLSTIMKDKSQTDYSRIPPKIMKQSAIDLSLTVYQDLYQKLLDYLTKVNVAEMSTLSTMNVVEAGTVPSEPLYPKKTQALAAGALLGLFCAFCITLLAEYADETIAGHEDLRWFPHPLLGLIPRFRGRVLAAGGGEDEALLNSYQLVLSSIQLARRGKPAQTLLVSGVGAGDGSAATAINLGQAYARIGKRVLLVDTDRDGSGMQTVLSLPDAQGMADVLTGKTELDRVVQNTGTEGISLLLSGAVPADWLFHLSPDVMCKTVREMKERYDIIIFHTAPTLFKNDALQLMNSLDGMILVVRRKRTPLPAIALVLGRLEAAGIEPVGFILN